MAGAPSRTYRIPLVLLAAANLAILGAILWPWQEALNLPVKGTTAIDPAITLIAYMGLLYWMSSGIKDPTRDALAVGTTFGIVAGLVLAARVLVDIWTGHESGFLHPGLLGLAVILWGVAGLRSSRAGDNAGLGALSGLWSAMVSALIACSTIFAELYLAAPIQDSPDPWKQYQGLAIGNSATQGLVHSLNTATAFLLLGPLTGAAVGITFAYFGQSQKS
jgi:hypothetical protein